MLKFYGLFKNSKGNPERYSIKIDLLESLNAVMVIHDHFDGDQSKTAFAVKEEIEKLYSPSSSLGIDKTSLRQRAAKWFRCKDIIQFLFTDAEYYSLKLQVIRILVTPKPIPEKWKEIESVLAPIIYAKGMDYLEWRDSPVEMILEMVVLAFLDQNQEWPPANLELSFIKGNFPKVVWRKRNEFHQASDPFWKPKNPYCSIGFLFSCLFLESAKQGKTNSNHLSLVPSDSFGNLTGDHYLQLHSQIEELPFQKIEIKLEGSSQPDEQMEIFPKSASETLLSLQKLVQKKYSHEGVKHLLWIIKGFSEADPKEIFQFDDEKYLLSITGKSKKNGFSAKQRSVLEGVLDILERVSIKRTYNRSDEEGQSQISTSLVLKIGQMAKILGDDIYVRNYLLDPIFFPAKNNLFRLGQHLSMIPQEAFGTSSRLHALVPGLSGYFSGTWLNEYGSKKGVLEKKATEIIEGCAFNVTPANRVRLYRKLGEELVYMKEQSFIGCYTVTESNDKNPMDALYQITASEFTQKQLASYVPNIRLSA